MQFRIICRTYMNHRLHIFQTFKYFFIILLFFCTQFLIIILLCQLFGHILIWICIFLFIRTFFLLLLLFKLFLFRFLFLFFLFSIIRNLPHRIFFFRRSRSKIHTYASYPQQKKDHTSKNHSFGKQSLFFSSLTAHLSLHLFSISFYLSQISALNQLRNPRHTYINL